MEKKKFGEMKQTKWNNVKQEKKNHKLTFDTQYGDKTNDAVTYNTKQGLYRNRQQQSNLHTVPAYYYLLDGVPAANFNSMCGA